MALARRDTTLSPFSIRMDSLCMHESDDGFTAIAVTTRSKPSATAIKGPPWDGPRSVALPSRNCRRCMHGHWPLLAPRTLQAHARHSAVASDPMHMLTQAHARCAASDPIGGIQRGQARGLLARAEVRRTRTVTHQVPRGAAGVLGVYCCSNGLGKRAAMALGHNLAARHRL